MQTTVSRFALIVARSSARPHTMSRPESADAAPSDDYDPTKYRDSVQLDPLEMQRLAMQMEAELAAEEEAEKAAAAAEKAAAEKAAAEKAAAEKEKAILLRGGAPTASEPAADTSLANAPLPLKKEPSVDPNAPLPRRRRDISDDSAAKAARLAAQRIRTFNEKQEQKKEAARRPAGLKNDLQGLFVSEWMTQHPLHLSYPQHIWVHADCPPNTSPETPEPEALQRIRFLNESGNVHLQQAIEGARSEAQKKDRLDSALAAYKEMEGVIKEALPSGKQRLSLLACCYTNTAGYYYRMGLAAPALQYAQRGALLEERALGAVDFSTKLRLATVYFKAKDHQTALTHGQAAIDLLIELAEVHGIEAQSQTTDGTAAARAAAESAAEEISSKVQAHLAVAYHNLAVQLAYPAAGTLQKAHQMVNVADQLAALSLPAKHRWARQICSTVQKLRDLHVSTSFVQHSLGQGSRSTRRADELSGQSPSASQKSLVDPRLPQQSTMSSMRALRNQAFDDNGITGTMRGSMSLPALVDPRKM